MPGQYKHLAPALARDPKNTVAFITKEGKPDFPGIMKATYKLSRTVTPNIHQYLNRLEDQVLHGQGVARAAMALRSQGFEPDVICAHTGWGEALFLRDIYPEARILAYCEFFYNSRGSDIDFSPNSKPNLDRDCRTRMRNTHMLISLEEADWGISPTEWQRRQHPSALIDKISVIHDGVDTEVCRPNPAARFATPNGLVLSRDDEVITYVARNLEPYRGFDIFMQSLGEILRRRPKAEVIVVGGDEVSYGGKPKDAVNWREYMLPRVNFDARRVHFVGRVPYDTFRSILSISRAHIYLTYPFVLSWSMIEAMAHECLVVGSNTPPVVEVIRDGVNGLLVDYFDPAALAEKVISALETPDRAVAMRKAARRTVVETYDLRTGCLPRQLDLIARLHDRQLPPVG